MYHIHGNRRAGKREYIEYSQWKLLARPTRVLYEFPVSQFTVPIFKFPAYLDLQLCNIQGPEESHRHRFTINHPTIYHQPSTIYHYYYYVSCAEHPARISRIHWGIVEGLCDNCTTSPSTSTVASLQYALMNPRTACVFYMRVDPGRTNSHSRRNKTQQNWPFNRLFSTENQSNVKLLFSDS